MKYLLFGLFALLTVLAAVSSPVWYDDAGHYLVIEVLARHRDVCYPVHMVAGDCRVDSPFITLGPMLNYPLAVVYRLSGGGMLPLRLAMACFSLLSLLAFWKLGKAVLDKDAKMGWAIALVIGNVQFVSYGAQVLGEVPMLGWLFLGMWAHARWLQGGRITWAVGGIFAWFMAILTKEYIALPIAVAMLGFWAALLLRRDRRWLAWMALGIGIGVLLWGYHLGRAGGLAEVQRWFVERQSYGSEFLAFDLRECGRFLLFKPLVVLGTAAMALRVAVRARLLDVFLLCFQLAWLLFFLSSAGYDRFGFQLIFLPALYLSEFILTLWERWTARRWWRIALFAVCFIGLFSQRTLLQLAGRLSDLPAVNAPEKAAAALLERHGLTDLFTYDQQLALFLPDSLHLRFSGTVPSNAIHAPRLALGPREYFLAGPYAFTEFQHAVDWTDLELMGETGEGAGRYVLYRKWPARIPPDWWLEKLEQEKAGAGQLSDKP